MKQLLLGGAFAGDEIDVIEKDDFSRAIALAQRFGRIVTQRAHQLVGELLKGAIDGSPLAAGCGCYGTEEVGLADAAGPVQKHRAEVVVAVGDRLRGGMGELILGTYDESVHAVGGAQDWRRGLGASGDCPCGAFVIATGGERLVIDPQLPAGSCRDDALEFGAVLALRRGEHERVG